MKEEKKEEMYNETETLRKVFERIQKGIRYVGKDSKYKNRYEQGKPMTPYNLEVIERFCITKSTSGVHKNLQKLQTLQRLGFKLDKDFNQVTPEEIDDYLSELEKSGLKRGTIDSHKQVLKTFYLWLKLPLIAEGIIIKPKKENENIKSTELLTQEDIRQLIQHCQSNKDRCLISVLYETGCRVSELRGIRIKDLEFERDSLNVKLFLTGKTGTRRVLIRDSVPYIKVWLNEHPKGDDRESYLFISNRVVRISYNAIVNLLDRVSKRAGILKPNNPHSLRHSRCTHLASYLTEQQLKVYFGWTKKSNMASVYCHLSGSMIDSTLLSKVYNVKDIEKEVVVDRLQPKVCPKCKEQSPSTNKFCGFCSHPLDFTGQEHLENLKDVFGEVVSEMLSKKETLNEPNSKERLREKLSVLLPLLTPE